MRWGRGRVLLRARRRMKHRENLKLFTAVPQENLFLTRSRHPKIWRSLSVMGAVVLRRIVCPSFRDALVVISCELEKRAHES